MFRRLIAWLLRKRGPAAPRGKSPASPPLLQEANRTRPKTDRPETNTPGRAPSLESDETAIPMLKDHVIFPRCKDRENTDRIYAELVSIFGAARILQTGGQNTRVAFWSVDTTDDELTMLREGLEANGSVKVFRSVFTCDPTDNC